MNLKEHFLSLAGFKFGFAIRAFLELLGVTPSLLIRMDIAYL
jgi:hypothetical protein